MSRFLLTADLHQFIPKWEQLVEATLQERPDFLLIAGDLLPKTTHAAQREFFSESRAHSARHEKLAALGTLAAGVAHEIRNPLTAINVRELESVVRQVLLLARGYSVSVEHVQQASARSRKPVVGADQTIAGYFSELLDRAQRGEVESVHARMLEDMERELFTRGIQLAQGNQAKAARWLGVTRTTMREKLIHFGLCPAGEKPEHPG